MNKRSMACVYEKKDKKETPNKTSEMEGTTNV
jgi:hypothetical protein